MAWQGERRATHPSRSPKPNPHPSPILPCLLQRGVGVAFGPDVAKRWLEANGLQMVVRSHEVRPGCSAVRCGAGWG